MLPDVTGRDFASTGSTSTLPSQVAIAVARERPCVRSHCGHWSQWHGLPLLRHSQLPTRLHNGGGGAEAAGPKAPARWPWGLENRHCCRPHFQNLAVAACKPLLWTVSKLYSCHLMTGCHLPWLLPPYAFPLLRWPLSSHACPLPRPALPCVALP